LVPVATKDILDHITVEDTPVDGRVKVSQLWSFKSEPLWA